MQTRTSNMDQDTLRGLLEADEAEMSVVISDPYLPDNPMIYVSDEFEDQTGYSPEEAVGRNCRFLQGQETSPHAIEAIRPALPCLACGNAIHDRYPELSKGRHGLREPSSDQAHL